MNAPVLIRPAVPADAEALAALARRTFLETFGPQYDPADMTAFLDGAYSPAKQLEELENPAWVTLLAEADGEPVGFAQLVLGSGMPCVAGPAPMELNRIYALRATHGTGLGNALMEAVLAEALAQGGGTLWLGVWERNDRAQAFYRRWGFERVGGHVFRVGSQCDTDDILARPLQAP